MICADRLGRKAPGRGRRCPAACGPGIEQAAYKLRELREALAHCVSAGKRGNTMSSPIAIAIAATDFSWWMMIPLFLKALS